MYLVQCVLFCSIFHFAASLLNNVEVLGKESKKMKFIAQIVRNHHRKNDWQGLFFVGNFPDELYTELRGIDIFITSQTDKEDYNIEDIVNYVPNTILLTCSDFRTFEQTLNKALKNPYWHPLSQLILYYQEHMSDNEIAILFFIFWYYRIPNSIILRYDEREESFLVSQYNPYVYDQFKMDKNHGCWTNVILGIPIGSFENSFTCMENCENITQDSMLREMKLGTCIGFKTDKVLVNDLDSLNKINLFPDKGENLHGYSLRAYGTQVLPFMVINEKENGSYTLEKRDGDIWNTLSERMNFSIDLTPSKEHIKKEFNFEVTINQIYNFAHRKIDILILPTYIMDHVIVDIDLTFPYKASGVCFMSRRADFETIFDIQLLFENVSEMLQLFICFILIWLAFVLFSSLEKRASSERVGRDLLNTIRCVLSVPLCNAPRNKHFRIILLIVIWVFYMMNFLMQAAIISFFAAHKRGRDVDTFDDVIEKGFWIMGMASPDVFLPEDEEKFQKINSKLVAVSNMDDCVQYLSNGTKILCLLECSVARYYERNKLNQNGELYLHVADDRIHNRYLNMIFQRHSPLTKIYNKYIMTLVESGIINKWEQYRYIDFRQETPLKPLGMEDVMFIFECLLFKFCNCIIVFILEILVKNFDYFKIALRSLYARWKAAKETLTKIKICKRQCMKKKSTEVATQTLPEL